MSEEEIIKYTEETLNYDTDKKHNRLIEDLLHLYQKEKQKNIDLTQELESRKWVKIKENGEVEPLFYISKDKIKDKIKELDKVQKVNTKMFNHGVDILSNQIMETYSNKIEINMTIRDFLQELLEEE